MIVALTGTVGGTQLATAICRPASRTGVEPRPAPLDAGTRTRHRRKPAAQNGASRWFVVMAAMVIVTAAATSAGATIDVTGRWAGKLVCKVCCGDGFFKYPAKDVVWLIKQ